MDVSEARSPTTDSQHKVNGIKTEARVGDNLLLYLSSGNSGPGPENSRGEPAQFEGLIDALSGEL